MLCSCLSGEDAETDEGEGRSGTNRLLEVGARNGERVTAALGVTAAERSGPFHIQRVDFLRADIAGEDGGAVGG